MLGRSLLVCLLAASSCEEVPVLPDGGEPDVPVAVAVAVAAADPPRAESALAETARLPLPPLSELRHKVVSFLEGHPERRVYVQVDWPLYKPGETLWVRVWDLSGLDLSQGDGGGGTALELVSPRGTVVLQKKVQARGALLTGDIELPADVPGGEYKVRARTLQGAVGEREVIVAGFEAPRIQKTLEFLRKAYGPGDEVSATVELKRATGEALSARPVTGAVRLDGKDLPRIAATTDAAGRSTLRFALPASMETGDGILTVLVEDGGVTESISRRIPILLKKMSLALLPEGGSLVQGLASRIYFEAQDSRGKPADVEARVVDDLGNVVARMESLHAGLGRFEMTPATGRTYHAEIVKPAGVSERFALPVPQDAGCVLRSDDDPAAVLAVVRCTSTRKVIVTSVVRERLLDAAAVEVPEGGAASIRLASSDEALSRAMGVARVTLFSIDLEPLAERLVFRNLAGRLSVEVKPDREAHAPGDEVRLHVRTTDQAGRAVPADLALSVVDETVLSYADDKAATLLYRTLVEPEIPGSVEDPNFFFDPARKDAALSLDILLGTRGYRRFEWHQVLFPTPPRSMRMKMAELMDAEPMAPPPEALAEARGQMAQAGADEDREEKAGKKDEAPSGWTKARVFPEARFEGPAKAARSDFRDTVFWAPEVRTGKNGRAEVTFRLSDAITSFRVTAEGAGAGTLGAGTARLSSSKPLSLDVKLPLEVSRGDRLLLPVSLASARGEALDVALKGSFGPGLAGSLADPVHLAANEHTTRYVPLDVTGVSGTATVRLSAIAGSLSDSLVRQLPVSPDGFPRSVALSGELEAAAVKDVNVEGALAGTVHGELRVYPSPVSTMMAGLDGMLQEPGGCFEQTSSTNYPNVMVLQYLQNHGIEDPAIATKAEQFLKGGYQRLTGFEAPHQGFEWFGGDPGHEALTAYGLVEFADMKNVFPAVDGTMVARTAAWLRGRRDGKGGYLRDGKALDSFGRASADVTNAYITHALLEAGFSDLPEEVKAQARLARTTGDAYLLALATDSLARAGREAEGSAAAEKLSAMQEESGAFTQAESSITRSTGMNLHVETTALATLALIRAGGHDAQVRKAVSWLTGQRAAGGNWGATQATVLALKALVTYEDAARRTQSPGTVIVKVGGREVARQAYEAGRRQPLVLDVPLAEGASRIELLHEGGGKLPFTLAVSWRNEKPAEDPASVVGLETHLEKDQLHLGEAVRLTAVVKNRTDRGPPMALARVGLPAGLSAQTWQLKELREKGTVAFFETRPREVVLYFRDLKPGETKTIPLELTATSAGTFTAPPSSAYLYYGNEHRTFLRGVKVSIEP